MRAPKCPECERSDRVRLETEKVWNWRCLRCRHLFDDGRSGIPLEKLKAGGMKI